MRTKGFFIGYSVWQLDTTVYMSDLYMSYEIGNEYYEASFRLLTST
jgi:hypothetical protein